MAEIDAKLLKQIKKTQEILGKHVKKPPLTDKNLIRPPFRFLHDVFLNVMDSTGYMNGLFTKAEIDSANLTTRESKTAFMQKVIDVIKETTGENIEAKVSKVLSGSDADKTNELLQYLGRALDQKINSDAAVQKITGIDPPPWKGKGGGTGGGSGGGGGDTLKKSKVPAGKSSVSNKDPSPYGRSQPPTKPTASKTTKGPEKKTIRDASPASKGPSKGKTPTAAPAANKSGTKSNPPSKRGQAPPSTSNEGVKKPISVVEAPTVEDVDPASMEIEEEIEETPPPPSLTAGSGVRRGSNSGPSVPPPSAADASRRSAAGSSRSQNKKTLQTPTKEDGMNPGDAFALIGELELLLNKHAYNINVANDEQSHETTKFNKIPDSGADVNNQNVDIIMEASPPPQTSTPSPSSSSAVASGSVPLKPPVTAGPISSINNLDVSPDTETDDDDDDEDDDDNGDDDGHYIHDGGERKNELDKDVGLQFVPDESGRSYPPLSTSSSETKRTDSLNFSSHNDLETNLNNVLKTSVSASLPSASKSRGRPPSSFTLSPLAEAIPEEEPVIMPLPSTRPHTSQMRGRPPTSARPPSARPAPPRPKSSLFQDKEDYFRPPTGRVANVLLDSDDVEDENYVVHEVIATKGALTDLDETPELAMGMSINNTEEHIDSILPPEQRGHLVNQILETQRELEDVSRKKTEIERDTSLGDKDKMKFRETTAVEVEKLKLLIQTTAKSANPMGKLLDFIREDVDAMHRDMEKWREESHKLDLALEAEQKKTESSLEPLRHKLSEIDTQIQDKEDAIAATKMTILRQEERIHKILLGLDRVKPIDEKELLPSAEDLEKILAPNKRDPLPQPVSSISLSPFVFPADEDAFPLPSDIDIPFLNINHDYKRLDSLN